MGQKTGTDWIRIWGLTTLSTTHGRGGVKRRLLTLFTPFEKNSINPYIETKDG